VPGRAGSGLAWDGALQRLLLFGGATTAALGDTWAFGDLAATASAVAGPGCSGAAGPLRFATSPPRLADLLLLELGDAPPGGLCAFAMATGGQPQPLGGGCTVYLSGVWLSH
jgi:hypothetical protein